MIFKKTFCAANDLIDHILGVPLAVALTVIVQNLWVNETLGEDIPLAGSSEEQNDMS